MLKLGQRMSDPSFRQFRSRGDRSHEGERITVHIGDSGEIEVDFLRRPGEPGHTIYFGTRRSTIPSAVSSRRTEDSASTPPDVFERGAPPSKRREDGSNE